MAARFWVGGSGTWDNADTTHWSATTGGAGGASVPTSSDTVTFDASSGAGTCTVNHATLAVQSITMGAWSSGILDFSVNNNSATISSAFSITGTATREIKMGSGTFTLSGSGASTVWNAAVTTGLTFTPGTSSIVCSGNGAIQFNGGTLTYPSVTFNDVTNGQLTLIIPGAGCTFTVATFGKRNYQFGQGATLIVSNVFSPTGTASAPLLIEASSVNGTATIQTDSPVPQYVALRGIAFTGVDGTATDSFDMGGNTGITITPPSGGGGGQRVVGG
jgi:hypothetical protein